MAKLNENIARVKADFRAIKGELVNKGASIPSGTPTSQYANIIKNMSTGSSEEAYEQGRQDVIAESKYIPKTATGKVISLTDVSEVAHKVKVYGDNQEVEVYGKNLLPYPYRNTSAVTVSGVTITPNEDGSIHVKGTSTATCALRLLDSVDLKDGITYKICDNSNNWAVYLAYTDEYGSQRTPGGNGTVNVNPFTWKEDYKQIGVYIQMLAGYTVDETIYPMLSFADSDLSWESYKEPQTIIATPTGAEIDSMCPNMNFIADSDITVDYYSSFGMNEKELAMWNGFTNFGKRETYTRAFSYCDFSGYTIPEGLCKPTVAIGDMFYAYNGLALPKGVDCSEFNTTTTSLAYHMDRTFAYSLSLKSIYDIGVPEGAKYSATFRNCSKLETIEIIRCNEQTIFDIACFNNCPKLTHVIFSGVIASDINLQWSKLLDAESLVSLAVTLAHLIETGENPDGTNIPDGLQFNRTVTLSPESWAILDNTLYPGTGISCSMFITTVKGWNRA